MDRGVAGAASGVRAGDEFDSRHRERRLQSITDQLARCLLVAEPSQGEVAEERTFIGVCAEPVYGCGHGACELFEPSGWENRNPTESGNTGPEVNVAQQVGAKVDVVDRCDDSVWFLQPEEAEGDVPVMGWAPPDTILWPPVQSLELLDRRKGWTYREEEPLLVVDGSDSDTRLQPLLFLA